MTVRPMDTKVRDHIPVNTVLASVSDKAGLDYIAKGLITVNPNVLFLSTGGTYKALRDILGNEADRHVLEVARYTDFPEMEGGLVKTLHPKIHAGLLGERNNQAHQEYLAKTLNGGRFIDMVLVNLYPFQQTVSKPGVNFEGARGNIDIGGPAMLRAAAKNFPSCAAVCDPADYRMILSHLVDNGGSTSFDLRLGLAAKVFESTAVYDRTIADYFAAQASGAKAAGVKAMYKFEI